jgi:hypothetical protein
LPPAAPAQELVRLAADRRRQVEQHELVADDVLGGDPGRLGDELRDLETGGVATWAASTMIAPMRPDHRAQLAAAVARFQADIRRLARAVLRQERDRLLTTVDPTSPRAKAAAGMQEDQARQERQESARIRQAERRAARAQRRRRRQESARRRRAEAGMRATATASVRTESMTERAAGTRDTAAAVRADSTATATAGTYSPAGGREHGVDGNDRTRALAARGGIRVEPVSATTGGSKRVRWTREAIINELASWMLSGTAIDASFLKRHGPPGLVPATLRVFGRFDAALNVAGLHVARLYPDGPPAR